MDVILELFSFQGRANRGWYFWHSLLDGAVVLGLILAIVIVGGVLGNPLPPAVDATKEYMGLKVHRLMANNKIRH